MTVICSGYFDPIHEGHIEYLEKAAELGDKLIVIVNNDYQGRLKKGGCRISSAGRMKVVSALRVVDSVYLSIDNDKSVCESIRDIVKEGGEYIFAKGGDRKTGEIPESEVCRELGVKIIDGLGEKINSSSKILGEK